MIQFKKNGLLSAMAGTGLLAAGSAAHAEVPTEISTAIASMQADAISLLGLAGAAGVAVLTVGLLWTLGMAIVPKFLKRGAKS